MTSCQAAAQTPEKPSHHTGDGFRNIYPFPSHGTLDLIKWRWQRFWDGIPARDAQAYDLPVARNDPEFLRNNSKEPTLTWIGHATFLLQFKGRNILTDPHFTERASPFSWAGPKRIVPPGVSLEALPRIDAVVISHNHYDHLDLKTVQALAAREGGAATRFFVPLGLKSWFADAGITNVVELDWWEGKEHAGLTFRAVPAQHFSRRSLGDTNETLWAGWTLEHPEFKFFFAGDTAYSPNFREIGRRLGPFDLAALPIGAYEPRWFMKSVHLNPAEAVRVHQEVGARFSVAMHWGTFDLTDELPKRAPEALREALTAGGIPPGRFFLMKHGETRPLDSILVRD